MSDYLPADFDNIWEEMEQLELELDLEEFHTQHYPEEEPHNNAGRTHCYWCGKPTEKRKLLTSIVDMCSKCDK